MEDIQVFNRKSLTLVLPFFTSAVILVNAQQQKIKNAVPYAAQPLPLAAVRVTGGPLKRAQDLNAE